MTLDRLTPSAIPLLALFVSSTAHAADYFVAPTGGNDSGACSMAAPCATVEGAQSKASAGDTVWVRGGTYSFSGTSRTVGVAFSKSGQQNNPIRYFAYENEIPVFDLTNLTPNARVTGFDVTASWIHIRGMEIRGVQQYRSGEDSWGLRIRGSNNVIERMNVHHNEAPGIFITSGANNLILNCDSHHNYDEPEGGGSGDGFGCHSTGANNVMRGCRGYANSDDGYDFINSPGVCIVENSWAFNNGYVPDTTMAAGNGAGFKAGGFGSPPTNVPNPVPRHVVRQCVAFGNRAQGFYANHHPGGLDFFNNIAFRNGVNYNMLTDTTSDHKLRNNIAMSPGTAINNFTGGTDDFNSWTLEVTANASDFLSTMESEALAPREPDGSLPNVNFLRLVEGSDLIDKGEDVGLPFAGSAPDLGPFELGLSGGTGGMGGAGGMAGTGGTGGAAGTPGGGQGGAAGSVMGGASGSATGGDTNGGSTTGGVAGTTSAGAGGSMSGGSSGTGTGGASAGTGSSSGGSGAATGGADATGGAPAGGAPSGGSPSDAGSPALGGMCPDGEGGEGCDDTSCSCRVAGRRTPSSGELSLVLAGIALALYRRRTRRAA